MEWLIGWLICGVFSLAAYAVASNGRDRGGFGSIVFWCLLAGPFGALAVVFAFLMSLGRPAEPPVTAHEEPVRLVPSDLELKRAYDTATGTLMALGATKKEAARRIDAAMVIAKKESAPITPDRLVEIAFAIDVTA